MKFKSCLCLCYLTAFSQLQSFDPTLLTYESLSQDSYTEHVAVFRCLFSVMKVRNFLEFGLGKGTKYFLDHCDHVTSIEISIASRAVDIDPWYQTCVESYAASTNWTPLFHRASDTFDFYNCSYALDYWTKTRSYFPKYLDAFKSEVNAICQDVLQHAEFDVAFVDPGIFTRADFVNALFDHVDVIVAHDTHNSIYGWPRVIYHPDYERIDYLSYFGGTSFWIKKTKASLIDNLKHELNQLSAGI